MSDIKKMKKVYKQYQKINNPPHIHIEHYDDGGQVDESPEETPVEKNYRELMSLPTEQERIQKYNDAQKNYKEPVVNVGYFSGGDVEPSPSPSPSVPAARPDVTDALKKAAAHPQDSQMTVKQLWNKLFPDNDSEGGQIKGYDDGGQVSSDPVTGSIDPNSPEGLALIANAEYPEAQKMNQPEDIKGEEQDIEASPTKPIAKPASELDVSGESPEDKELKNEMANEDFVAKEKSDEKPSEESDRKLASEPSKDESEVSDEDKKLLEEPDQSSFSKLLGALKPQSSDLAEAQRQRDQNLALNNAQQGFALMGAGMAKASPAQELALLQQQRTESGLPVQKYNEIVANQQNDASSPMSQVIRDYLNKKGMKVPDNASASDLFKIAPFLQKDSALQTAMQKVILQQNVKQSEGEKNRTASMERTKSQNAARIQAAKAGQEFKMAKESRDAEVKMENDITNARSKPAIQQAYRNSLAIKNALKMFQEFPDPDKWTPQQVKLYNIEMAKVASNNAPTEGMIKDLSNPTAASGMAGYMQKIANVPVGAQQGEFIKLNQKYLNGLADVSNQVIKDNMGNVVKAGQDKLTPEQYKNAIYRHSDMLGLYTPAQERGINAVMQAKGLSRQDAIKSLIQQKALKDTNY